MVPVPTMTATATTWTIEMLLPIFSRLLIDADTLVFAAAAVTDRPEYDIRVMIDGVPGEILAEYRYKREANAFIKAKLPTLGEGRSLLLETRQVVEPEEHAFQIFKRKLLDILENIPAMFNGYQVYLGASGVPTHRHAVYPQYKSGRPPKPKHFAATIEYAVKNWSAELVSGMEVDDKVALEQVATSDVFGQTCIVSIDKDLNQVPGWHYHPDKGTLSWISEWEAELTLAMQVLTGDSTDSIPGLPGVGPAKAKAILKDVEKGDFVALWDTTEAAYEEHGFDAEYFSLMCLLVTMLGRADRLSWLQEDPDDELE